jgi:ADP-ribose pyrophosphatase YjhB (NUDIX family)
MTRIHLATGIAIRDGALLLVASLYPSHSDPIWSLPGGRQRSGELFAQTLVREVSEETGLQAAVAEFAYLSESYDGETHILNTSFEMSVRGDMRVPLEGDHIAAVEWCPLERIEQRMTLRVARDPLMQYLRAGRRYRGFLDAGVSVRWHDER